MPKQKKIIYVEKGLSSGLSTYSDNTQLVNYYPIITPGERSPTQLVNIAGSTKFIDITPDEGTGCRGTWVASTGSPSTGYTSTLYGVWGNTLFRITNSGNAIRIGNVNSKTTLVTFAENQDQTATQTRGFVCDGTTIFQWDLKAEDAAVSSTFTEIQSLPDVLGDVRAIAKYITYNTYRLILTAENAIQWFFTDPNDTEFIGFESSESNPDKTVRAISFGGNVWVFSNYSYDIFSYTGSSDDPYDVASGATGKIGCTNGDTIAVHGDFMFWMGQGETSNDNVYMASVSGAITEITNPGISNIIRKWKYKNNCRGFAFTERGNTFYCLTSKLDKWSLVYCVETKQWHRRSSSMNGMLNYWDVVNVVNCYGTMFFGTNDSNKLCKFNYETIVDHNDFPVTRYWQSSVYIEGLDFYKLCALKVDVECGTSMEVNYIPEIFIQISFDGGKTWSERLLRSLGQAGDYLRQVEIRGCGAGRNLVLRIGTSANIPITLYQFQMEVESTGR